MGATIPACAFGGFAAVTDAPAAVAPSGPAVSSGPGDMRGIARTRRRERPDAAGQPCICRVAPDPFPEAELMIPLCRLNHFLR
jgi:hypothetical protein